MGVNVSLDLNSALERYRQNKSYNKKSYDELLAKYEEAIKQISVLEKTVSRLQKKTIPTSDEVASIKVILELFSIEKLDSDGISRLFQIQNMVGGES